MSLGGCTGATSAVDQSRVKGPSLSRHLVLGQHRWNAFGLCGRPMLLSQGKSMPRMARVTHAIELHRTPLGKKIEFNSGNFSKF
jgi:hypothetical protein